jgi:PKD repeat protein
MHNFKKFLTILTTVALVVSLNAQTQPTADVFNMGAEIIVIDGDASDGVWETVTAVAIDQPFQQEQPSLNLATWKAVWNIDGIYLAIEVSDNVWMPNWLSDLADWQSDKIEIYIDCTDPQKDGGGASTGGANHQVAPNFSENNQGVETEFNGTGVLYADTYDGTGNYTIEYYIPFAALPDNNGNAIDPSVTKTIGFDVTVIDCDEVNGVRNRMVWSNIGDIDESWNNMDDVGLINFMGEVNELFARFSASSTIIGPGGSVVFTDYSTGEPTEWAWDFGDGNTSTEQNPEHIYSAVGNYSVTLTVTNAEGTDSQTKSDYIIVSEDNIPPVASFSSSTVNAKVDEVVNFTDESLYAPVVWSWYFGDGSTSTEQNPSHIYKKQGVYEVSLKVSNDEGSNSQTKTNYITIVAGDVPKVEFEADQVSIDQNVVISFTDMSQKSPTGWLWDFGDGNSSEEQNPSHVYTIAGIYSVSLTATNNTGSATETKENFISVANVNYTQVNDQPQIFSIYPNPSNGKVHLTIDQSISSFNSLLIYTLSGRKTKFRTPDPCSDYQ